MRSVERVLLWLCFCCGLSRMIHFAPEPIVTTAVVPRSRKKAVWGPKRRLAAVALAILACAPNAWAAKGHSNVPHDTPGVPGRGVKNYKVDDELSKRAAGRNTTHVSSVIVELVPGAPLPPEFKKFARKDSLDIIHSVVLDLPDGFIAKLAAHPNVFRLHDNRPLKTHNYRTAVTVGARVVQQFMGYTGAGVGIAVIDTGVTSWHDDLTNKTSALYPYGNQRVTKFVDFVNGQTQPYDDNGHGSHVAGIILGNGYDSSGEKAGIAPGASLISLKVLDANGQGTIGNMIAALNWIAQNYQTYNIRVVNMSIGAAIRESYWTDPLTLAVKQITDRGITVVSAAGNVGKNKLGQLQWGGITAPGNAPWVLTVGASSTMGTLTRSDDTMADYSSSGPTYIDYAAKPDLVAPGTGTISLAVPGSTFYAAKLQYLVGGTLSLGYQPYLALSGTSMAAPVVSGTVALMLQANPNLTPNLIKAILQYTSQVYKGYSPLRQGSGFLNSYGAVLLSQFYAKNKPGSWMPTQSTWSRHIIWGNHVTAGGYLNPNGNAWAPNIVWGTAFTQGTTGQKIVWGSTCGAGVNCGYVQWGQADSAGVSATNVVWGTDVDDLGNIVWGTDTLDNIVWGTDTLDNVVWGTDCGGADCANVVWGTVDALDNIVWGTDDGLDNVVWGTDTLDNIVWGTSADADVTWGSSDAADAPLFPDDSSAPVPDPTVEFGDPTPAVVPTTPATSPVGGI
jgi:serine protease AprX